MGTPLSATFAILVLLTGACPAQEQQPGLAVVERGEGDGARSYRTGVMRVWENRRAAAGRLISLEVVVLEATGAAPVPDPVFVIAGGPGQNAASMANAWGGHWMREERDIVLVSQRGTGGDNRLWCDTPGSDMDLQAYLGPIFVEDVFRDCLARLSEDYDLTQYSTANAADDLNDVRLALGYDQINLYGGSYGSRAALEYVRRHPETVRVAILNGVAPVSFINPLYHARSAQDALDLIIDECAADPACLDAYGDLRAKLGRVLRRLLEEPVQTSVFRRDTGEPVPVLMTAEAFAEGLRIVMYYDHAQTPYLIDRADSGDFTDLAETAIAASRALRESLAFGMLLCVTCAEDLDRITEDMIERETEGTFLGDGRVRRQKAVCAFWPRSELPPDAAEPVSRDVPVLLLSGVYDPVTPPRWGEEAERHLPRGLHVVGPGSHGLDGPCIDSLVREVLSRGTVDGLDTSCVEEMSTGPFRLPD